MTLDLPGLLLGALATWRLASLLHAEDGPFDLFALLRDAAGSGFWGKMLACFRCTSLWAALPFAWMLAPDFGGFVLGCFALSAGAILVQERLLPPASWVESEAPGPAASPPEARPESGV